MLIVFHKGVDGQNVALSESRFRERIKAPEVPFAIPFDSLPTNLGFIKPRCKSKVCVYLAKRHRFSTFPPAPALLTAGFKSEIWLNIPLAYSLVGCVRVMLHS